MISGGPWIREAVRYRGDEQYAESLKKKKP